MATHSNILAWRIPWTEGEKAACRIPTDYEDADGRNVDFKM